MAYYAQAAGLALALYLLSKAFELLSLHLRYQKAAREHGCKPATVYPDSGIYGLKLFRRLNEANKKFRRFEVYPSMHRKYGDTFAFKLLGFKTRISTCHPRNIQTIVATNSDDWGVEPLRRGLTAGFVGKGVFSEDGDFHKFSRALIKPIFNRSDIADLDNLEIHVARFLDLIPKDGSTIDLQPLFKRLVRSFTLCTCF